MKPVHLLLAATLALSQSAWCDEADHYNRVSFASEASRKVDNDLLTAQLSVEINDKQPARIAQQITATLKEVLQRAKEYGAVKVSTGYQNTEPVYGKNEQFVGYRGHAELRLESRDFEAVSKLIAHVQDKMQLAGINFSIAPETRKQVEHALTAEAIAAFRKQADAMLAALNGNSYKIVHLDINQQGERPKFQTYGATNDKLFYANNAVNQPLSGGQGEIVVQVAGTIEIAP